MKKFYYKLILYRQDPVTGAIVTKVSTLKHVYAKNKKQAKLFIRGKHKIPREIMSSKSYEMIKPKRFVMHKPVKK